jgi:hypothetical protein
MARKTAAGDQREGEGMTLSFRRLTTGRNAEGKSVLADEARIEEGTLGNFNFWTTRPDGTDGAADIPFFPPPGGSIFRVFRLPPGDPPPTASQLASIVDEFFKGSALRVAEWTPAAIR